MDNTDGMPVDELPTKQLKIFGRDVSQMPCFRNSWLYGISGGIAIGVATFLGTSRPQFSTHVGFGSFLTVTLCYWVVCRYQWSKTRFEYLRLQEMLRQKSTYEGTEKDGEIFKEA